MRITQGMMVGNFLYNLNNNTKNMDKIQEQLATGSRINRPSDDPVGIVSSLRLRAGLMETEKYLNNVNDGNAWLNTTETALRQTGELLQSVRELTIRGASDTLPQASRDAIAAEIDQLREQLMQVGNTTHDGRYVFAGFKTTTQPFSKDAIDNIVYNGDSNLTDYEIGINISINVNVTGDRVYNNGLDVFAVLGSIRDDLMAGDTASLSGVRLGELDQALNNVLSIRTEVGAKTNRLDLTRTRLEDSKLNINDLLAKNESIDVAETITELKMQENTYRTALAAGARIIQPTLLDFLR